MAIQIVFLIQKFIIAVNVKWKFEQKSVASNVGKKMMSFAKQHIKKEK